MGSWTIGLLILQSHAVVLLVVRKDKNAKGLLKWKPPDHKASIGVVKMVHGCPGQRDAQLKKGFCTLFLQHHAMVMIVSRNNKVA